MCLSSGEPESLQIRGRACCSILKARSTSLGFLRLAQLSNSRGRGCEDCENPHRRRSWCNRNIPRLKFMKYSGLRGWFGNILPTMSCAGRVSAAPVSSATPCRAHFGSRRSPAALKAQGLASTSSSFAAPLSSHLRTKMTSTSQPTGAFTSQTGARHALLYKWSMEECMDGVYCGLSFSHDKCQAANYFTKLTKKMFYLANLQRDKGL